MPKARAAKTAAAPAPDKSIKRWTDEVELYERDASHWTSRSETIVKRYRDERDSPRDGKRKYNVLYAITETTRPALYARNPKPDIQRRFKDADPIGRVASDILERASSFFVDTDIFKGVMRAVVMDYLLPGRGTVWVRYVPHMRPIAPVQEPANDAGEITEDVPDSPEVINYEEVATDYVHWKDYGHNICRTWDEVWLVWRKVYLDRDQLNDRFGEELAATIPLDYVQKDSKGTKVEGAQGSKATIYEAWDKIKRCAVWFHKDMREYLDLREDPLKLTHFFPCPKILAANLANDSLIPVPFFVEYQDQANELDELTARIASITKSLKVAGVYDSSAQGLNRLLSEGVQNKLIPVDSWATFAEKGGIKGAMDLLPLQEIVGALESLYSARDKVKQDLYDITGIADIIRGQSDPGETMGAQQIKSNFATLRIGDHQRAIQEFVREIVRLVVEVIGGHFQIETIAEISGVRLLTKEQKDAYTAAMQRAQQQPQAAMPGAPPSPQPPPAPMPPPPPNTSPDQFQQMMNDPTWEEVGALIKNNTLRSFRIDIETDSTIKQDEQQEKADRVEFLKAAGGFLNQAVTAGAQNPELGPLLGQMLLFGIRGFPIGKELEGTFNTTIQKLEKQAANPTPKPSPEMAKIQGELALSKQKAESDIQVAQAEQQAQAAQAAQENQLEAAREQARLASEERIALAKINAEAAANVRIAHVRAFGQIVSARIAAGQSDGAAAEIREMMGEGPVQGNRDVELHGKMDMLMHHLASQPAPAPAPQQQPQESQQQLPAPQPPPPDFGPALQALAQSHQAILDSHERTQQGIADLHKAVTAEKEIVRDPKTGKPSGIRVKRDVKAIGKRLK